MGRKGSGPEVEPACFPAPNPDPRGHSGQARVRKPVHLDHLDWGLSAEARLAQLPSQPCVWACSQEQAPGARGEL